MKDFVSDDKRALAEVNADYATTTELADTLQRVADVPFRVGHHFASELVNFGRGHSLKPAEIPYGEAQRIYTETAKLFGLNDAKLPLTDTQFRTSLTAENMVQASQGLGGPQPAEVARMLAAQKAGVAADRAWLAEAQGRLMRAAEQLDVAFGRLTGAP
jgi:argininosuccinate lyase